MLAGGQQLLARALSGGQGSVAWLGPGDVGLVRASARRIAVAQSAGMKMLFALCLHVSSRLVGPKFRQQDFMPERRHTSSAHLALESCWNFGPQQ